MKKIVLLLRSGDFLTRERMTRWAAGLILGYVFCCVFLGLTAHGVNDYAGRPLGTDFSNVYAAGVATAHGDATAPFNILRQEQTERAIFGTATQLYGWHYPPFFLLVAAALARLPYIPALILWQAGTLMLYLGSVRLLLRKSAAPLLSADQLWPLLALGFTAVFVNATHGQNGFLTAALFASGLALLDERPVVAGMLFGLLCYKPQFAVVIPLVLAATGRWRAFSAAAATVLAAGATVTVIFGAEIWPAFMASAHFTRTIVLEQGNTGFYKLQSVFAAIRMWGGSVTLAYGAQAAAALMTLFGLVRIWRGNVATGYKGAALCLAALLVTPYSLDYDLMLLAPAIVLLIVEGTVLGFKDYERLSLAALWFAPAIARNVAHYTLIPLAVPAMAFCLGAIYLRCGARRLPAASGSQPMRMAL
jgi:alpha-1,2-mannosyltransferase